VQTQKLIATKKKIRGTEPLHPWALPQKERTSLSPQG